MDLLVFIFYSTLLFGWCFGIILAASYHRMRDKLLFVRPELRSHLMMGGLLAPLVMGLFMTLLLFFPYSPIRIAHDLHCSKHLGGAHLLLAHSPLPDGANLPEIFLVAMLGAIAAFLVRRIYKLVQTVRSHHELQLVSQSGLANLRRITSDQPLAFSAGLWSPQIYISSSLEHKLNKRQQRVVIAHERAHIRRHDSFRYWLGGTLSFLHLPATRRLLLSDLTLAAEQACDKAASSFVGNSFDVAETILKMERLMRFTTSKNVPLVSYFYNHHVADRIEVLVGIKSCDQAPSPLWVSLLPALIVAGLIMVEPLHHKTEWILGVLLS
jgi:Zn-dependent protease with chaperone function